MHHSDTTKCNFDARSWTLSCLHAWCMLSHCLLLLCVRSLSQPTACATHKESSFVLLGPKCCAAEGCTKQPSYGPPGEQVSALLLAWLLHTAFPLPMLHFE